MQVMPSFWRTVRIEYFVQLVGTWVYSSCVGRGIRLAREACDVSSASVATLVGMVCGGVIAALRG